MHGYDELKKMKQLMRVPFQKNFRILMNTTLLTILMMIRLVSLKNPPQFLGNITRIKL
jgi:hypothetical protein